MSDPVARVTYSDPVTNIEQVAVGQHLFQFGGVGDGFCYFHQSFRCLAQLTGAERAATSDPIPLGGPSE